jgi:GT2 family glycosyltransferase
MPGDLLIAYPTSSHCAAAFTDSLVRAVLDERLRPRIASVLGWFSGPLIAAARTGIVETFLKSSATWLLQIDSDMQFNAADVLALLQSADEQRVPIVSALYCGTGQFLSAVDAEAGWWVGGEGVRFVDTTTASGLTAVDFTGAGMLLVHRSVFERMATDGPQPWFQESERDGRVDGEDWEFSRRAVDVGFPVHVHADVRIGHVKSVVYRPKERR